MDAPDPESAPPAERQQVHDARRDGGRAAVARLADAPRLGPYCPITGRRLRPWWSTILWAGFHALSVLAIFVAANHLHTLVYGVGHAGRSTPVFAWFGVATAVYVAGWFFARLGFATRLVLSAGAVWAVTVVWSDPTPVSFADPNLAWTGDLDAERERWDRFLAEAGLPPALALFALLYALAGAFVTARTSAQVARSWNLPKRLWFARYHPVWRRRYSPAQSAHPIAGVLWVADDELLTDKLVWLRSDRRDSAFRLAPPEHAADPAAIPLGALDAPITVWRERDGQWHTTGELPPDAARLRLFFAPPAAVERTDPHDPPPPLVVPVHPGDLPVRDLYPEDEACLAKRYDAPAERGTLFGLLLDSRPVRDESGRLADVPRFTALVRVGRRLFAERPHPDLVGEPHVEGQFALLPWRGAQGDITTLELDAAGDSVHFVAQDEGDGYWLAFVGFEADAAPESAT